MIRHEGDNGYTIKLNGEFWYVEVRDDCGFNVWEPGHVGAPSFRSNARSLTNLLHAIRRRNGAANA